MSKTVHCGGWRPNICRGAGSRAQPACAPHGRAPYLVFHPKEKTGASLMFRAGFSSADTLSMRDRLQRPPGAGPDRGGPARPFPPAPDQRCGTRRHFLPCQTVAHGSILICLGVSAARPVWTRGPGRSGERPGSGVMGRRRNAHMLKSRFCNGMETDGRPKHMTVSRMRPERGWIPGPIDRLLGEPNRLATNRAVMLHAVVVRVASPAWLGPAMPALAEYCLYVIGFLSMCAVIRLPISASFACALWQ